MAACPSVASAAPRVRLVQETQGPGGGTAETSTPLSGRGRQREQWWSGIWTTVPCTTPTRGTAKDSEKLRSKRGEAKAATALVSRDDRGRPGTSAHANALTHI